MPAVSRPLHDRRHRGENCIDVAAGAQAEDGAAIIQEIEFDIAPAPYELFFTFGFGPGRCKIAPDEVRIDLGESAADILREGEIRLPVPGIEPVVEDAADAAHLVAVLQVKIFVAPVF